MSGTEISLDNTDVFDPRRDEVMQCPFGHYDHLRANDPVHRMPAEWVGRSGGDVYAITRYDLVARVLSDWRTFSSRFGSPGGAPPSHLLERLREIAAEGYQRPPTMLTADPPVHTRYRKLVAKAFTPSRVSELRPTIELICDDLAAGLGETAELVSEFCVPIPTRTIAAALGVPQDRYADFKRWADASVATIGRSLTDEQWIDAATGVVELQQYFAAEFEARRVQPTGDLLSDLVAVRLTPEDTADEALGDDIEGVNGEPLSMPELISVVQQLQVAGSETTASLIADAIVLLADHPDEWQRLADDPSRAVPVVEECLRLASPNQGLFRVVTTDTELAGVPLPAGSTVWVLFGAANRDPDHFAHADVFDPDRPAVGQHLAFGRGIHYCIGAPLARLEATIGLHALARNFERVEPIDGEALRYAPSCILRGLERLDARLVRR
jgi:cytochrome P450